MSEAAAKRAELHVKDYMTSNPETLSPEDRLLDA